MVVPFDEYDFENDESFSTYLKNVELTGGPHDQEAMLKRLQAKWYKNNVDPDFVPPAQEKAPEPVHRRQAEPRTTTDTPPPTEPPQAPSAQQQASQPSASSAAAPKSLIVGLNAIIQAAMLAVAFVFLLSYVMQNYSVNLITFRIFLQGALTSHVLRLVATVGYPQLWPFKWPEVQQWLARISGTSDAHYASVCFLFAAQQPNLVVLASPSILAALRLAAYVRKNLSSKLPALLPLCDRISSQREKAFHAMAVMDLTLLGVVITRAFTQKSVLLVFVYVNMLRHRYKAQVSAKYHQAVWGVLVGYAQPVLSRMPSPVHTGLGYLTRWFTGSAV